MIVNLKPGGPPGAPSFRVRNSGLFYFHSMGRSGSTGEYNTDKNLSSPTSGSADLSQLLKHQEYLLFRKGDFLIFTFFFFHFLFLQISSEPLFWVRHLARHWEFRDGSDMVAVGLMKDLDPGGDEPRTESQMWKLAGGDAHMCTGKRGG